MKNIKNIDFIYVIGTFITLFGFISYYLDTKTYLMGDSLYKFTEMLTPIHIFTFIFGGIIVIIVEILINKDYPIIFEYLKKPMSLIVLLTLFVTMLSIFIPSYFGVLIVYLFVIGIIVLTAIINKNKKYIILITFLTIIFLDGSIFTEYIERIYYIALSILGILLIFIIYLIIDNIIKYKNRNIRDNDMYLLFDYVILAVMAVYFEAGTYISGHGLSATVEKIDPYFNIMSLLINSYASFMLWRLWKEKNNSNITKLKEYKDPGGIS